MLLSAVPGKADSGEPSLFDLSGHYRNLLVSSETIVSKDRYWADSNRLRLEAKVFNAALARAVAEGLIVDEGATVRLPSHAVRLNPEQRQQVDALLARFRRQPYATPSVKESIVAVGEEVLGVLVARGELVQVSPEVLFLPQTYEEIVARIRARIEQEGSITLAQTRDMLGTSRKYAQGLLEHLDEIGVTKRVGGERVLR